MRWLWLLLALPACTGIIGDAPAPPAAPQATWTSPNALRRLTALQYRNAVEDLLGPGPASLVQPPQDASLNGYASIGASGLSITTRDAVAYERSAWAAARVALTSNGERIVGCPLETGDQACLRSFAARLGRLAYRRTLTPAEVEKLAALGRGSDFPTAVRAVIAGVLQSPDFLFRVEAGTRDPALPGFRRLTGPELATRLAFFLTGTGPQDELIAAAERGELDDAEGLSIWAWHLLKSPRARGALFTFLDEMLGLGEVASAPKSAEAFPLLTRSLREAMREETLRLAEHVGFDEPADFLSILDAPYTFVNGELAAFYGLPGVEGGAFVRVDLPADGPRAGILGHASFLLTHAHTQLTSPTLRGRFVREVLLCQGIPSPPPKLASSLPEPEPGDPPRTMRERLASHASDEVCAGCHVLMDPIGLGLETFDAVGAARTEEQGIPIDPQVDVPDIGRFRSARELGALLRRDPRVPACLVRNLFRHATGHVELPPEELALAEITRTFEASGRRLPVLLHAIATSAAFRRVPEPTP